MKDGRTVIACAAPYASGGLGRHLTQLVEEARAAGELAGYFATGVKPDDPAGRQIDPRWVRAVGRYTPVRFSPLWQTRLAWLGFDRAVAGRLPRAAVLSGFEGMALSSFRAARRLGYRRLELESAMSHVDNVIRQLDRAYADYPIEPVPFGRFEADRQRAEYAEADVIWVTSQYTRETFLAAGVAAGKLRQRTLHVPARFHPPDTPRPADGVFRAIYIGSLTLRKGIPVLLEAFRRLTGVAELTLVGGSGTRGMRRFLATAMAADPRIRLAPGDPLPHLHRADVCVHPAYEDGFAYAPMEALACGVPVVVTDQTGMKEHVREGVNGYVVPAGDPDALFARLESLAAKVRHDRPV
jgi:glycosyltransferase involved in cell wall biosynthesis